MDSTPILNTTYMLLTNLADQFLESLDGIPENDLNSWKPSAEQQGGGEMNTFAALAVHVVAAARWRIEEQTFDIHYPRDRENEFSATATKAEIDEFFSTMINEFRTLIASDREVDLTSLPGTIREDDPDRTRLDWLLSAIDHTALHVGHVQIHRQLWLAERANTP